MNSVSLVGRLATDPELKYTPSGKAVCEFRLAVQRPTKDKECDFIPVTAWGQSAEFAANYLTKGAWAAVQGRMQVRSWEKDGQKHWATEVQSNDVRGVGNAPSKPAAPAPAAATPQPAPEPDFVDPFENE
jgi:single-strand DNA-binding protein